MVLLWGNRKKDMVSIESQRCCHDYWLTSSISVKHHLIAGQQVTFLRQLQDVDLTAISRIHTSGDVGGNDQLGFQGEKGEPTHRNHIEIDRK